MAPWPDGKAVPLQICAGERCALATLDQQWRTVRVLLPAASNEIALRSPTFTAPDGRELGVFLDWAEVRTMPRPTCADDRNSLEHSICSNLREGSLR